jgi:hypothetical protein
LGFTVIYGVAAPVKPPRMGQVQVTDEFANDIGAPQIGPARAVGVVM